MATGDKSYLHFVNKDTMLYNSEMDYSKGSIVVVQGRVYEANDDIAGGGIFSVGTTGATWKPLGRGISEWFQSGQYAKDELVFRNQAIWQANSDIPDGTTFSESATGLTWTLKTKRPSPEWDKTLAYSEGDHVSRFNCIWEANGNISANTDFTEGTENATWKLIQGNRLVFQDSFNFSSMTASTWNQYDLYSENKEAQLLVRKIGSNLELGFDADSRDSKNIFGEVKVYNSSAGQATGGTWEINHPFSSIFDQDFSSGIVSVATFTPNNYFFVYIDVMIVGRASTSDVNSGTSAWRVQLGNDSFGGTGSDFGIFIQRLR